MLQFIAFRITAKQTRQDGQQGHIIAGFRKLGCCVISVVTAIMLNADVVDSFRWIEADWSKRGILRDLFHAARRCQQLVDASWRCLQ